MHKKGNKTVCVILIYCNMIHNLTKGGCVCLSIPCYAHPSSFFFKPRILTYRTLVPWRGAEPLPSAVKAPGTNYWTVREFPQSSFLSQFLCVLAQSCWLFVTLQTITHQASLSMGFSRQEYWSGLPCPAPWDLPNPGIDLEYRASPGLQSDSLLLSHQGDQFTSL